MTAKWYALGTLGLLLISGCSGSDDSSNTGSGLSQGSGGAAGSGGASDGGSGGSTTGGSTSGGNGSGGDPATGGSGGDATGGSGGGGDDCTTIECFRPYECVTSCGSTDVLNNGCCPCPDGMIDTIECPTGTVTQGVSGTVLWLEGNHMPGGVTGTTEPVSREVRIYEVVTEADAVAATDRPEAYSVYDVVNATLVAATTSDEVTGFYEVALDPGTYSVFVEDGGDWYCNSTSAAGLCTITVETDTVADHRIQITYAAAF